MKIKEGFKLRKVAGNYIVIATGKASREFNGMINLNEVGAFLWQCLEKNSTKEQLVQALLNEYDVSEEIAIKDVDAFVAKIEGAKLVEQ